MRINALIATLSVATLFALGNSSAANAQTQNETTNQPTTPANVVVQSGDSLSKLASAHATTYVRLYDANTQVAHPDKIFPGQNLRIPAAEEQLVSRPLPQDAVVPAPAPAAAPAPKPQAAVQPRATQQAAKPAAAVSTASAGVWDRLAQCESGGNWSINTGNGFYGGLQFTLSSWQAVGGTGLPSQASKSEQIARAEMLKARQGWGAWPACSAKLGLR